MRVSHLAETFGKFNNFFEEEEAESRLDLAFLYIHPKDNPYKWNVDHSLILWFLNK